MVAAALQVPQTKTALVTLGDCDGSIYLTSSLVSNCSVPLLITWLSISDITLSNVEDRAHFGKKSNLSLSLRLASSLHPGSSCFSGSNSSMLNLGLSFCRSYYAPIIYGRFQN